MTPRLSSGTVSVWWTALGVTTGAALDAAETHRAERFVDPVDRRRFVAARSWLREVLGTLLDEEPAALSFSVGPSGKPALSSSGLHFNLSHSRDRAVLAVASSEVGVDLEHTEPGVYEREAAAVVLSPDELSVIEASPDPDGSFVRHWTRKEAYAKARGGGLTESLAGLSLLSPVNRHGGITVSDLGTDLPSAYVAVATTSGEVPGELQTWTTP